MRITLFRHAPAEDREQFFLSGRPDSERPLTEEGIQKLIPAALGLARVIEGDPRIFTSDYLRCQQTANILAQTLYGDRKDALPEALELLRPDAPIVPLANWIARQETERDVLLVGHEPNLSQWASWWLGGPGKRLNLRFKKGSAMQLSMKRADRPAQARLEWMLQPRQLRLLDLP